MKTDLLLDLLHTCAIPSEGGTRFLLNIPYTTGVTQKGLVSCHGSRDVPENNHTLETEGPLHWT